MNIDHSIKISEVVDGSRFVSADFLIGSGVKHYFSMLPPHLLNLIWTQLPREQLEERMPKLMKQGFVPCSPLDADTTLFAAVRYRVEELGREVK